ncbi:hypothetical protein TVAG_086480 [Trichomonas vaginalis G3]|uniref:Initiator binding domain-containing protein n=1 Tax=Trichomonas vaginalis (strain ATCC PRA-98 / G3) TaxID=412133 RepID=A2FZX2_TRIV3|nr:transcription-initiator DNA-binding domain ibd family [Trichomonas vaginalis G3]EAX89551.1 hypothetical protein TVAG_086480 [Trichomonas vaginalis G3]KAI5487467.1 transcription-initiator DNA-binding domain ibd family [Trichomonas vaginalis G3]|eukprot:XP_001302481.1 hypothetical protein [Trichomonas vaginalis G3]
MTQEMPDPPPKYWERLSDTDKLMYVSLRASLSSPNCKNRRNKSAETFREIIDSLKTYVIRGDADDKNRALVCGIYWLKDSIAINTRQLIKILSKCKSSINGSFQQLGYGTIPAGADSCSELIKAFPELKNNFAELRQWTIRQLISATPNPSKLAEFIQRTYQVQNIPYCTPQPLQPQVEQKKEIIPNNSSQYYSAPPPEYIEPPKQVEPIQEQPQSPQPEIDSYTFENDDISNFMWNNDMNF